MRIALLTYSTKPRGSVIHSLELANAFHQIGHQVCIYALDKDGLGFDRPIPCTYQPIPAKAASQEIDQLIRQRINEFVTFLEGHLRKDCHTIFHAQDCISANALAVLRQRGLIPHFVRTVHHIEDYQSTYLLQCQEQSIRQPDLCLCVSSYWQQQLIQQYQVSALRVINGVDLGRFSFQDAPQDLSLKRRLNISGSPVFLTVGGIEPRKNTLQLVKAFAQVRQLLPQAQLIIAGGATLFDYREYREEFLQMVNALDLESAILLPGVISDQDLPSLYRCADAFVFPSLKEGWGLVVLEAIASGLPTVVSHRAPFTEFLSPEQTIFIPPEDSSAIALAMHQSVQPKLAQSLFHNSRSILQFYSWTASAIMHLNHYQALLHARNSLSDPMA
ncbi:MAG: MSMEG_0565 family glycosyltransferase [Oscillatoriales cyanobacterium SM2_2_1]|nr:MSMEG_0565 family glycosyltransferase [Oscillatoriales cyanobacterium SM2_2_1]